MKWLRTGAIVTALIALLAVGFLLFRGPQPHIEIKAEPLWTIGPVEITNTLFTSWFVVAFLVIVAIISTRKLSLIPGRWQNAIESVIEFLYGLVVSTGGEQHARRFFPVIATIFLYVLISNWFGLLPFFNAIGKFEPVDAHHFTEEAIVFEETGGVWVVQPGAEEAELEVDEAACEGLEGEAEEHCIEEAREEAIAHAREELGLGENERLGILAPYFRGVNTDLMSPLSLAIVSAIFVEYWGISTLGLFAYGSKFFNFGRLARGSPMGIIDAFVGILEFIAEVARVISFTFRLFGNMLAGEILLLMMTFLIPFLLALPFYGLEIFVGAIQAFVFAMLTLVFAALAVTSHDEHHDEHPGLEHAGVRIGHTEEAALGAEAE